MRVLALLHAAIALSFAAAGRPRVDAGVHRTLKRQGTANLIVTMRDDTKPVLESMPHEAAYDSRGAMIEDLMTKLKTHASDSQAEIAALMAQESSVLASEVRSFWISNQVYFRDASFELVEKLSAMAGVADISEEAIAPMPTLAAFNISATSASSVSPGKRLWNIEQIQAPEVWQTGNTGQGVVVGSIDSGVRVTHKALKANFRREFGWFDPANRTTEPWDDSGHGTHITATIAGADGYGVAPGATWIACKGGRVGADGLSYSYQSDVLTCCEFMLCPRDPTGTVSNCGKAPRVINNSWGFDSTTRSTFSSVVAHWRFAGIIPVFSAGNGGPQCYSMATPGDIEDTMSVGATDRNDGLAYFSSRGPAGMGKNLPTPLPPIPGPSTVEFKPDITAPRVDILSAWLTDDEAYASHDGTSASAPHVAGVIALLLSAEPRLTHDQVLTRLRDTADQDVLQPPFDTCGRLTTGLFPNCMYGSGRVNALSAIKGMRAPVPGKCDSGLDHTHCDGTFLCTWSIAAGSCQRWW